MMVYIEGNLFESPARVLVNTVNTVGVMGKGIALTFKIIYPDMFNKYQQLCEGRLLQTGKLWLYKTPHKWILNFPTKEDWRQPSKPEYIERGLQKFVSTYPTLGITSIAFPQLGCGNGELNWDKTVQPLMIKYLSALPIDVFVYIYRKTTVVPEHKDTKAMTEWLRNEPKTLAFSEMWTDLLSLIGAGLNLASWDGQLNFRVTRISKPPPGLLIRKVPKTITERLKQLMSGIGIVSKLLIINNGDIFISEEAILDLWQTIREYGFCVPRIMPDGLDILAPYLLALFSKLSYMKKIELTRVMEKHPVVSEVGLQLSPMKVTYSAKAVYSTYAIQPV